MRRDSRLRTLGKMAMCNHPKSALRAGPRIALINGSAPTEVCTLCGAYRTLQENPGPWRQGPPPGSDKD